VQWYDLQLGYSTIYVTVADIIICDLFILEIPRIIGTPTGRLPFDRKVKWAENHRFGRRKTGGNGGPTIGAGAV
jgi:hypothetical protein